MQRLSRRYIRVVAARNVQRGGCVQMDSRDYLIRLCVLVARLENFCDHSLRPRNSCLAVCTLAAAGSNRSAQRRLETHLCLRFGQVRMGHSQAQERSPLSADLQTRASALGAWRPRQFLERGAGLCDSACLLLRTDVEMATHGFE